MTATEAQTWTNIGPLGSIPSTPTNPQHFDNGRVASVAVDPTDSNHWLAGTGQGGVWESRNTGTTWTPITDNAPTLTIGAVAFAPSNPKVIYVGTGESDGGPWEHTGLGILKSTDGGQTWSLIGASTFARGSIRRIRVHPANPNLVLAASSRSGFGRDAGLFPPSPPPFGIWRSTDGGATWTLSLAGQATAIEIDPTNFSNQYAAIGDQRVGLKTGDAPGSLPNGVYRSTDGGLTWNLVTGPWGTSTAANTPMGRVELAIAPSNPSTVYASMQIQPGGGSDDTGLLGLYRTDDAWSAQPTWIRVPTDATGPPGYSYCDDGSNGCGYAHVLTVDPANQNTAYAGGVHRNLWRCDNCGASPTWNNTMAKDATVYGDLHDLAWAGSRLIQGNDHGMWSTADGGATWQNNNATLNIATFYGGALHPRDPEVIMGAVRDLAGAQVRSGVGTWTTIIGKTPVELGEAEFTISTSWPDTDWMLADIYGMIGRSLDGGQTWIQANTGIDTVGSAFVAPVRKCPGNDDVFLTGSNRLWRTNAFFSSATPAWLANSPADTYPIPTAENAPGTIFAVEFLPSDTTCNTYVYGNRGGSVQLTKDGGKTWNNLDPNKTLPARPVNWLAFDPSNPDILYAALSNFDEATPATPGHVFKSRNAMATSPLWQNVSPPQNQPFDVIAVDPANPLRVYAGSDLGMWRSTDGTKTWTNMGPSTGLPNVTIYDIKINAATGRTVAFTYGRGAYALGPELADGTAANGATYIAGGLVTGSWAQVKGFNLSGLGRIWASADFSGLGDRLPTKLSGVAVTVNDVSAAVYYISPTQVSFQVPAGVSGTATVQVTRDGVPSNTVTAAVVSTSPAIFPITVGGRNYPAGVFLDGTLTGDPVNGSAFRKARPGDIIQLYATGLSPSPAGTRAVNFQALSGVTLTIGDVTFSADAAGLVSPGEFQVNFTVPEQFASMPEGNYPITIQVNGVSSPTNINSNPPAPLMLPIQH